MEVAYDTDFDSQRERYHFCFTCEHCAHFDDETGDCLHGFPSHMHRLTYYLAEPKPLTILFCKDFDLA
ncbi:MAG: hypothetical protein GY854_34435 [Deltaproteobacteria bacterium]|nr:hypothetical protein [Deltaproteobacteria bacterium]